MRQLSDATQQRGQMDSWGLDPRETDYIEEIEIWPILEGGFTHYRISPGFFTITFLIREFRACVLTMWLPSQTPQVWQLQQTASGWRLWACGCRAHDSVPSVMALASILGFCVPTGKHRGSKWSANSPALCLGVSQSRRKDSPQWGLETIEKQPWHSHLSLTGRG